MSGAGSETISIGVHVDLPEDSASSLLRPDLSTADVDRLARQVLAAESVPAAEIDIVFCGDERITTLNREWLDSDRVTDVIAFPLSAEATDPAPAEDRTVSPGRSETPPFLLEGEIYVNLEQAVRQAPEYGSGETEEVARLIVHGLLHLLGYTDIGTATEAEAMKQRQEELVRGWKGSVPGGEH